MNRLHASRWKNLGPLVSQSKLQTRWLTQRGQQFLNARILQIELQLELNVHTRSDQCVFVPLNWNPLSFESLQNVEKWGVLDFQFEFSLSQSLHC